MTNDPDNVVDVFIRSLTAVLWFGTWFLLALAVGFLISGVL